MTQLAPYYKYNRLPCERDMTRCLVCGSDDLMPFLELNSMPVQLNNLWPTRNEAIEVPTGNLHLAVCRDCGHIFNTVFDSSQIVYNQDYENSLHFSPRFQAYAEALAKRLVEQYSIRHKNIIEVGSGKGDFLKLLCSTGDNRGIGFDPSYGTLTPSEDHHQTVQLVRGYYSKEDANLPVDLICSRHTLEHLEQPPCLVDVLRNNLEGKPDSIVYLEVPDVYFMLHQMSIWDFIFEHVSYFSPHSLGVLLADAGFDILDIREVYDGQFLSIEAHLSENHGHNNTILSRYAVNDVLAAAEGFASKYQQMVRQWKENIDLMASSGQKIVLWGAGSKGISFLNTLHIQDEISYVVDINPRKRGMYITGSGQEIVQPEFLKEYAPDTIIIMNPIYRSEIETIVHSMGLKSSIYSAV